MAKVDYNTKESAVGGTFEVLPKGRYLALIGDSDLVTTQDKKGKYFEFEFEALKGPVECKGRKFWARFNIHNPSETAQRIGREQFNSLCHAVGMPDPEDTVRLHGKLVLLIVDIDPAKGEYREKNIVTGYLKPTDGDASAFAGAKVSPKGPGSRTEAETQKRREAKKPAPAGAGADSDDDIPF